MVGMLGVLVLAYLVAGFCHRELGWPGAVGFFATITLGGMVVGLLDGVQLAD